MCIEQIQTFETRKDENRRWTLLVLLGMFVRYLQMFEQRHVARDDAKQGIFERMPVAHRDKSNFLEWSTTKTMVQIEEISEIVREWINATRVPPQAGIIVHSGHHWSIFSATEVPSKRVTRRERRERALGPCALNIECKPSQLWQMIEKVIRQLPSINASIIGSEQNQI